MTKMARRVSTFTESLIREMTRLSLAYGGINLSQGFPDFPAPPELKEAAKAAIDADENQYTVTWGVPDLRRAIAKRAAEFNHVQADPDREVTVTCGAAEAMLSAMLGLIDPGDEVILFEPYFETYVPDILMCGGVPVFVPLHAPEFRYDPDELERAITLRTKAIVVNTPHNPTGHVYTREELAPIARVCVERDLIAITDEIYEHLLYDGREHVSIASLPGMWERTVTISSLSKTYSATGWRVGYALAPADLSEALRRAHDYNTVCAPRPFQVAAIAAMQLPASYYAGMLAEYTRRRTWMLEALEAAGFTFTVPQGAYYVMADFRRLSDLDARGFVELMAREVGVIGVPATAFYQRKELGRSKVRFAFPKTEETIREAARRLAKLSTLVTT
ncbi:MAG: aminotransferase class I/II-fold pyridoxal phosphate-dependent enzyme [Chloroflexi bacterium]|nr:aminotransferase class I/II-fold pyridoxal phosphate-dependent enzyme [Chloroflexota bacterium]